MAGATKRTGKGAGAKLTPALQAAKEGLEKQHGKGALMLMGSGPVQRVATFPTGSYGLDSALGIGGYPRGRIVEIFGPESSGKTTLALHAVANIQKAGGRAAYVDAEHALDPKYCEGIGVDVPNLLFSQPDNGEQGLDVVETLVQTGEVDIIVVDSVAALTPKAEIEGEMGDAVVGLQARLMSQALRKLTGAVSKTKTCLIFINQIREKIGVQWGNPEVTTGGRALKFYASVRVDIRRIGAVKSGTEHTGNRCRAKVVKNKLAPPLKEAEFDILFGRGVDRIGELIDAAREAKVIELAGPWYSMEGKRLAQGKEALRELLLGEEGREWLEAIESKLKAPKQD